MPGTTGGTVPTGVSSSSFSSTSSGAAVVETLDCWRDAVCFGDATTSLSLSSESSSVDSEGAAEIGKEGDEEIGSEGDPEAAGDSASNPNSSSSDSLASSPDLPSMTGSSKSLSWALVSRTREHAIMQKNRKMISCFEDFIFNQVFG